MLVSTTNQCRLPSRKPSLASQSSGPYRAPSAIITHLCQHLPKCVDSPQQPVCLLCPVTRRPAHVALDALRLPEVVAECSEADDVQCQPLCLGGHVRDEPAVVAAADAMLGPDVS